MTIPFGSVRKDGKDIAQHLLRTDENELVELIEIKGAASTTLPGAMLEWEFQAKALTACEKPFFCLAIAPDETQGRYTLEQVYDYLHRVEDRNDLSGQPRAVVRHVKNGEEHFHVVWPRTDRENGTAKELRFWKDKLMVITRQFARDYGLILPEGYRRYEDKYRDEKRRNQLTWREVMAQKETGVAKAERMAVVTDLWKRRDDARSFVNSLHDKGYVLCTGRNGTRPVLVDIYGKAIALRELIDDRAVRQKHVQEFLGEAFAPDKLPTVEQAQAIAKEHRQAIEDFEKARQQSEDIENLKKRQAGRRSRIQASLKAMKAAHAIDLSRLEHTHKQQRHELKANHVRQTRQRRIERSRRSTGLAGFLGRITGVALIAKKIHKRRDQKRYETYRRDRAQLIEMQQTESLDQRRRHSLARTDLERECRSLNQTETKELDSLRKGMTAQHRVRHAAQYEHLPVFAAELKPPGRSAATDKAGRRFISPLAKELAERAAKIQQERRAIDLQQDFERAAGRSGEDDGRSDGDSHGPGPLSGPPDALDSPPAGKKKDKDFDRGI